MTANFVHTAKYMWTQATILKDTIWIAAPSWFPSLFGKSLLLSLHNLNR